MKEIKKSSNKTIFLRVYGELERDVYEFILRTLKYHDKEIIRLTRNRIVSKKFVRSEKPKES